MYVKQQDWVTTNNLTSTDSHLNVKHAKLIILTVRNNPARWSTVQSQVMQQTMTVSPSFTRYADDFITCRTMRVHNT